MNTITLLPKKRIGSLTLEELFSRYELSNRADGKSEKTIRWYREILRSFSGYLKRVGNSSYLTSFTLDSARGYILHLRSRPRFAGHPYTPEQGTPVSPRTVQCHTRALKAFSSWLYVEGYTTENRLKNLKLPKAPAKMIEPLTPGEIKRITSCVDMKSSIGIRNHAIIVTDLDNGLRASEIVGITLGRLNLQAGYIKVMGKGAKERVVPIGKYVQMVLWHYIDKIRPEPFNGDCDNLFLSREGRPITVNAVKLMFSRLARTSGVKRLHTHLCRHTFAINYLLNGGDIFSLKEILGHATFEMVNHYLHFTSAQITERHHKYSPMDKMHLKETGPRATSRF